MCSDALEYPGLWQKPQNELENFYDLPKLIKLGYITMNSAKPCSILNDGGMQILNLFHIFNLDVIRIISTGLFPVQTHREPSGWLYSEAGDVA